MTEGHPLLDSGEVEVPLEEYLHRVGEVFATIRGHDEEFERGAVIDQRTTVYTLGRAAFVSDLSAGERGEVHREPSRPS